MGVASGSGIGRAEGNSPKCHHCHCDWKLRVIFKESFRLSSINLSSLSLGCLPCWGGVGEMGREGI